jgi:hypothetical protein
MVIDGSTIEEPYLAKAELKEQRVNLPARFTEKAGFKGRDPLACLLLVVTPGRYRLLTEISADIRNLLEQAAEVGAPGDAFRETETNTRPATLARLIPCNVSLAARMWRFSMPETAMMLAPGERSYVFLLIVAGYIEVWFPDVLRLAVAVPISQILE